MLTPEGYLIYTNFSFEGRTDEVKEVLFSLTITRRF